MRQLKRLDDFIRLYAGLALKLSRNPYLKIRNQKNYLPFSDLRAFLKDHKKWRRILLRKISALDSYDQMNEVNSSALCKISEFYTTLRCIAEDHERILERKAGKISAVSKALADSFTARKVILAWLRKKAVGSVGRYGNFEAVVVSGYKIDERTKRRLPTFNRNFK